MEMQAEAGDQGVTTRRLAANAGRETATVIGL